MTKPITVECNEFHIVEAGDAPAPLTAPVVILSEKVTGLISLDGNSATTSVTVRADRFIVNGHEVTFADLKEFLDGRAF
jgi:hypothetical protein